MDMLYPTFAEDATIGFIANNAAYIHIGVGFGVARFDEQGNARASECGTSNKEIPTLEPKLYFAVIDYQHVTGVRLILWYHNVPKQ